MIRIDPHLARLDANALDALDDALVIESSRLMEDPARVRALRGALHIESLRSTEGPARVRGANELLPPASSLSEIRSEILEAYKKGVKIAPQTETRPLIPLYKAAKLALPPEIQVDHQTSHFDFYLVQVIFGTTLPSDQYPIRSEMTIKLKDDITDSARRTRPVSLFPARRDKELFKADLDIAIKLDASLNFSAPVPTPVAVGKAEAGASGSVGLKIGPLHFAVHKAVVEVTGEGSQNILWRYAFDQHVTGANDFKSFLVLKVAQEARRCEMAAAIALVPCRPRWLLFKQVLPAIYHELVLPVTLVRPKGKKSRPASSKGRKK